MIKYPNIRFKTKGLDEFIQALRKAQETFAILGRVWRNQQNNERIAHRNRYFKAHNAAALKAAGYRRIN